MTAAELLAYCPHWLKSINVLRRFLTNAGDENKLCGIIAGLITRYRHSPLDNRCASSSINKMMRVALERTGSLSEKEPPHKLGKRWHRESKDSNWDHRSIDVTGFRCPRLTHPRTGMHAGRSNDEVDPMQFQDLALHVREHPSGSDALDLTRCVRYALAHPEESWLFPTDFGRMVQMLGGAQTVTSLHTDRELFLRHKQPLVRIQRRGRKRKARSQTAGTLDGDPPGVHRESVEPVRDFHNARVDASQARESPVRYDSPQIYFEEAQPQLPTQLQHTAPQLQGQAYQLLQPSGELHFYASENWSQPFIANTLPQILRHPSATPPLSPTQSPDYPILLIDPTILFESELKEHKMARKLRNVKVPDYAEPSSDFEDSDDEDFQQPTQRATRSRDKQSIDHNAIISAQDSRNVDTLGLAGRCSLLSYTNARMTAHTLRNGQPRLRASQSKRARIMDDDSADDKNYQDDGDELSDDENEKIPDSDLSGLEDTKYAQKRKRNLRSRASNRNYATRSAAANRAPAARRAKKAITRKLRALATPFAVAPSPAPEPTESYINAPDVQSAARTFDTRQPAFLQPPAANPHRMKIDQYNVLLYSADGAKDHWASAYNCYRYADGPRRHAPFRELHQLSDPNADDVSDWAENIRWAKQQHRLYGSVWLEWQGDLEIVRQHRIEGFWVSEEMIRSGRMLTYR